ncbi:unnamed protein product, partial [Phaeothamnion confervicola]
RLVHAVEDYLNKNIFGREEAPAQWHIGVTVTAGNVTICVSGATWKVLKMAEALAASPD